MDLVEFEKFWVTEDMPDAPAETKYTPEARFCVKHYEDTTTFDDDGRARCSLPFKEGAPKLGNSQAQAIRRFLSLEARLQNEPKFAAKYQDFMQEFMDLGHLVLVPESEEGLPDEQCFYLPHHGVLKESSTTTKLRVVFDASAKTTSGVSLNSILGIGPRGAKRDFLTFLFGSGFTPLEWLQTSQRCIGRLDWTNRHKISTDLSTETLLMSNC